MTEDKSKDERAKQAERARKLLAQRKKKKVAGVINSATPGSPESAVDGAALPSTRTSLSLDDSVQTKPAENGIKAAQVERTDSQNEANERENASRAVLGTELTNVSSQISKTEVDFKQLEEETPSKSQESTEQSKNNKKKVKKAAAEIAQAADQEKASVLVEVSSQNPHSIYKEGSEEEETSEGLTATDEKMREQQRIREEGEIRAIDESKTQKASNGADEDKSRYLEAQIVMDQPSQASTNVSPYSTSATAAETSKLQEAVSLLLSERSDLQSQLLSVRLELKNALASRSLLEEGRKIMEKLENDKKNLIGRLQGAEKKAGKIPDLEADILKSKSQISILESDKESLIQEKESLQGALDKAQDSKKEQFGELEKSLERSREREASLEVEIGRLKQAQTDLTSNLKNLTKDLEDLKSSSVLTQSTLSELHSAHETLRKTHGSLVSEHGILQQKHDGFKEKHDELHEAQKLSLTTIKSLQSTNTTLQTEHATLLTKLTNTVKRAETAEKRKDALQSENEELVRQLEEVRGKVVQAMEEKAEMVEIVQSWEGNGKKWKKEREALERQLIAEKEEKDNRHAKFLSLVQNSSSQSESISTLSSQLSSLKGELAEARAAIPLPSSPIGKASSAVSVGSDELNAIKSAHSLEVSQLMERIRTLEAELYNTQKEVHTLSREVTYHTISGGVKRHFASPPETSPTTSPASLGLGSPSSTSNKRLNPVDSLLPASVRHKRQVSLTALKARMQSSIITASPLRNPTGDNLDGGKQRQRSSMDVVREIGTRKQFGDEIMFCCPACYGDLIIL
ncbi:hypothetical protein L204_105929 [Cryptococcus depauperatus]|nr:hypothetical protein L204_05052 [Cryptococcus depauperatus CBS 7855]